MCNVCVCVRVSTSVAKRHRKKLGKINHERWLPNKKVYATTDVEAITPTYLQFEVTASTLPVPAQSSGCLRWQAVHDVRGSDTVD